MDTLNYKCPNCSAGLTFDSKEQKMKCEFCGSTYSLEELDKLAEQQDTVEEDKTEKWKGFEPEQWQSDEKSNMAVWNCPSCGAEILAEKTTGSTVCPYCDNPMIMPEQFKDSYRPDYIIPFMKSKKKRNRHLRHITKENRFFRKYLKMKIISKRLGQFMYRSGCLTWILQEDSAMRRQKPEYGKTMTITIQQPGFIMLPVPER